MYTKNIREGAGQLRLRHRGHFRLHPLYHPFFKERFDLSWNIFYSDKHNVEKVLDNVSFYLFFPKMNRKFFTLKYISYIFCILGLFVNFFRVSRIHIGLSLQICLICGNLHPRNKKYIVFSYPCTLVPDLSLSINVNFC